MEEKITREAYENLQSTIAFIYEATLTNTPPLSKLKGIETQLQVTYPPFGVSKKPNLCLYTLEALTLKMTYSRYIYSIKYYMSN